MKRYRSFLPVAIATAFAVTTGLSTTALPPAEVERSIRPKSTHADLFPVKPSSNDRYLVDAKGNPFMIQGDTAWKIMGQLKKRDASFYLDERRQQGFNAILVQAISSAKSEDPPNNAYGDAPFTTPGDLSTPNDKYFAYFDWVLKEAAKDGILVFAVPAWLGARPEIGWSAEIENSGPVKSREYGRYLGERYKKFKNLVWVGVGDRTPAPGSALETNAVEILKGIKDEASPSQLMTVHLKRGSSARETAAFEPYTDLDEVYAANLPYVGALRRYGASDPKPTYLIEAYYEGYVLASGCSQTPGTPAVQRRQAYWTMTSGATGHFYGNHGIFTFGWDGNPNPENRSWKDRLGDPGTRDMKHLKSLFSGLPWYDLVPDATNAVVTAGRGTKAIEDPKVSQCKDSSGNDYVTAARTADGKLVVAYVPPTGIADTRTITVDMAKLSGPATARWFNPNTGELTAISGSPFANSGPRDFTTPGHNGDNTNDWVLLLSV